MKKVNYLVMFVVMMFVGIGISNAASLSVTANKTNVVVGSNVTITVTAKDAAGWEYCLSYDSEMFTLVGTTSDTGGNCVKTGSTLIGYQSVTYTLKAKKSGSSKVTLKSYATYGDDGNNLDTSVGAVTITAKTQAEIEASYSTNANLKLLDVDNYDISPSFNKDTTEYTLEVENDVEKIVIRATKADSTATISGTGEKELLEGTNKFDIVVTAEKGNKKTYTLVVTRKELNPITRLINGVEYKVVRKVENIDAPTYYSLSTATIDGEEVPAFKSEITGYVLLALKDEDGNVLFFKYDNNYLVPYVQLSMESFTFIVEETVEKIAGYDIEKEITINDEKVKGYVTSDDSEYVLIYGMNGNTGEKGWYLYDTKEKTFQRYNDKVAPVKENGNNLYFLLTIVFASISGLAIILIITLMIKVNKIKNKNEKLYGFIENKKEKREKKIDERFDSFSDTDEDENRKKLDETIHIEPNEEEPKLKELPEDTEEISNIEDAEKVLLDNISKANDDAFDNEDEIISEITERENEKKSKKSKKSKKKEVENTSKIEEIKEEKEEFSLENVELDEQEQIPDDNIEIEEKEENTVSYTQKLLEESVNENISKRELRRLEKLRRKEEKEELKKMQDDFYGDDN